MPKAFDAMTAKGATKIAALLQELPPRIGGFVFHGAWMGRRFVIRDITPADAPVASVSKDYATGTLTLSREILGVADDTVREMRSFGASMTRRTQTGDFDVATGFDSETHLVAAGHHIALCGHRGPWPEASDPITAQVTCAQCEVISRTKPNHRARLHPLTSGHPAQSSQNRDQSD